ncbi:chlorophyll a/b-binding protein [uncultured Prochlorococcus sp.]|uniref:chlorophyll a/b-binding protein n=1 Tax=uncultured Prochlorococcus sp. TaxID=159733 RepID=UPI002583794F|nr:chlorophyll a/b-binding protein [uncultured Prochlorococcus sp.]
MNSKEEQTNSEVTNLENESLIELQKDPNYINEQTEENKLYEKSIEIKDEYKFGWSSYSEITNGRFAMIGFLAIILIELFSKQSFLKWAGIA